jgi:KaiC/GvpD/RAD55 family RecA-like ATPase
MTEEGIGFGDYGPNFQRKLGQIMLEDSLFADQMFEVLEYDFFTVAFVREFIKKLKNYREEFGSYPSYEIIESVVSNDSETISDTVKKQMVDYVQEMQKSNGVKDADYVKKNSLEFCKMQALKGALLKVIDKIKDKTYEDAGKLFEEALSLGLDRDLGMDLIDGFENRYVRTPRIPIPTGQDKLDEIINGGLAKKEFGLLMGPSGGGKSMQLVDFAASAVQEGYNVIYYTLELQDSVVGKRIDSCITGIPLRELDNNKEIVYEKINRAIEGNLIIKEYPSKFASLQTIINHIEKTKRTRFNPDLILIDYADIMKYSIGRSGNKYDALGDLYTELRGVASRFNVALWTVSQVNREGYSSSLISLEHTSDAFSKIYITDLALTMQRTPSQKQNNEATYFVAKNRNGPDGIIMRAKVDTSRVFIDIIGRKSEEEHEEEERKEKKEVFNLVRKKWKEIKSDKN